MRRVHGNAEREVDDERVGGDLELRRIVLGEADRRIHDRRHRVDVEQHGEAALGEADDRGLRRQDLAEPFRIARAELLALLVAEGRGDAIERVELTEEQAREPAVLTLLQELLDEADAGASVLARTGFLLRTHSRSRYLWPGNNFNRTRREWL